MSILIIGIIFLFQIFTFFAFGSLFAKIIRVQASSVTMLLLSGFLLYFVLFGCITLPCVFTHRTLSFLTYLWMGISIAVSLIACIVCFQSWIMFIKECPAKLRKHSLMLIPFILVLLIQMIIVFTHVDSTPDACYYIGKVTTDVYTNSLGHYDPYTGELLSILDSRRVIACFPEYSAVISYFLHLHPLKQDKLIFPELFILLVNIIYYHIGLALFKNNVKKADGFVCFVFLINLYSYSIYTSSTFLFTRAYEGKSILANLVIPAIFLCFLWFWTDTHTGIRRYLLFLIGISSCIFSSSSMLVVPVGITAGLIPWIVMHQKWKELKWYFIYIIPNLIVCIIYFLASKNILVFSIT